MRTLNEQKDHEHVIGTVERDFGRILEIDIILKTNEYF